MMMMVVTGGEWHAEGVLGRGREGEECVIGGGWFNRRGQGLENG